jgi:hypothetical protein
MMLHGKVTNCKVLGRKRLHPNWSTIQAFVWTSRGKLPKTSVRIGGVPADTRTEHLQNINLEGYPFSNPLSKTFTSVTRKLRFISECFSGRVFMIKRSWVNRLYVSQVLTVTVPFSSHSSLSVHCLDFRHLTFAEICD